MMGASIATTSWKLVSQFDPTGIHLAMKSMDDSKKMIAGMTASSPTSALANPMTAATTATNNAMLEDMRKADAERRQAMVSLNAQRQAALAEEDTKVKAIDLDRRAAAISLNAQKQAALAEEAVKSKAIDIERRQASIMLAEQKRVALAAERQQTQSIIQMVRQQQAAAQQARMTFGSPVTAMIGAGGAGGFSRNSYLAMEAGRALEDMSYGFTMAKTNAEAFKMSLRGGMNNIAQMASMIHPVGGAIATVGLVTTSLLLPKLIDWFDTTKKIREETEKQTKAFKDNLSAAESVASFQAKVFQDVSKLTKGFDKKGEKDTGTAALDARDALQQQYQEEKALNDLYRERLATRRKGPTTEAEIEGREALKRSLAASNVKLALIDAKSKAIQGRANQEQATLDQKEADERVKKQQEASDKIKDVKMEDDRIWREYLAEEERKSIDKQIQAKREAIDANQDAITELRDRGTTANGSSSASIRGTSAAASAVNRAMAGTASVEQDNKTQIKLLEEANRSLHELIRKQTLKKGGLGA